MSEEKGEHESTSTDGFSGEAVNRLSDEQLAQWLERNALDETITIKSRKLHHLSMANITREPLKSNGTKKTGTQPFIKVNISGDGNCGYGAVAFAFLQHVISGNIALPPERYKMLHFSISEAMDIIEQRRNFFNGETTKTLNNNEFRGGQYRELVSPINTFLKAFAQKEIETFEQFNQLCSRFTSTLSDLCALNTVLAAVLRQFTYTAIEENKEYCAMVGFNENVVEDKKDQVDAKFEILQITAHFLELELHASMGNSAQIKSYEDPDGGKIGWGPHRASGDHTTPERQPIYIKCDGNYQNPHWDCLIEPEQFERFPALLSVLPAADQTTQELKAKLALVLENFSFLRNKIIALDETLKKGLTEDYYRESKPIVGKLLSYLFSMSQQRDSKDLIR